MAREEAKRARQAEKEQEAAAVEDASQEETAEITTSAPTTTISTAEPYLTPEGGNSHTPGDSKDTNEVQDQSNQITEETSGVAEDNVNVKAERGPKKQREKREPKGRGRGRGGKGEVRVYRAKEQAAMSDVAAEQDGYDQLNEQSSKQAQNEVVVNNAHK